MNLKEKYVLRQDELRHIAALFDGYKNLADNPKNCQPMVIVYVPEENVPGWERRLNDPLCMLETQLKRNRQHLSMGDDFIPATRVEFGTAQIAAAFGCEIYTPPNNLPAAGSHILENIEDIKALEPPTLADGWFPRLFSYISLFLDNTPDGDVMQLPDIQSAFNSAHLIRGNDILLDFYDDPEALDELFRKITNFMVLATKELNRVIGAEEGWFLDWGMLWKGAARISNCSMHMISPDFYRDYILPHDKRFFDETGGGRIHYCGTSHDVIRDFLTLEKLSGLDVDAGLHDIRQLAKATPEHVVLTNTPNSKLPEDMINRMLDGDFPEKRNMIFHLHAQDVESGKALYYSMKNAISKAM